MNITDRIAVGAEPERLRRAAFAALSQGQDDPAVQVRATAVALYAMCKATGIDIRNLLGTTERLAEDLDSPFASQMRAIEAYARNEITRRP